MILATTSWKLRACCSESDVKEKEKEKGQKGVAGRMPHAFLWSISGGNYVRKAWARIVALVYLPVTHTHRQAHTHIHILIYTHSYTRAHISVTHTHHQMAARWRALSHVNFCFNFSACLFFCLFLPFSPPPPPPSPTASTFCVLFLWCLISVTDSPFPPAQNVPFAYLIKFLSVFSAFLFFLFLLLLLLRVVAEA